MRTLLPCIVAAGLLVLRSANAAVAQSPGTVTLRYLSTAKINQLLGETDKQFHTPTLSRTVTRYGLQGTDLGSSFEHQGSAYFLFGDTVGVRGGALDTIATTDGGADASNPDLGVRLNFLTPGPRTYLTIEPPNVDMGAFNVPVSGISLGGQMYVVVRTGYSNSAQDANAYSLLTKFIPPATFALVRPAPLSRLPGGHFIDMSLHVQPRAIEGLPSGEPFVLMWGTGRYRRSDAYLALVPAAQFESGRGTQYFHGLDQSGAPVWRTGESDAEPVVTNGTMGDVSVTWCEDLGLWLMTYDSRPPAGAGILFSYAATPWGPWTPPQVIFNAVRDGAMGTFIHDPSRSPDDGLAGPVIGKGWKNPAAVRGGTYAPYVVERWTKVVGGELDLYYVLSTWNPYTVVLMKTRLQISRAAAPRI